MANSVVTSMDYMLTQRVCSRVFHNLLVENANTIPFREAHSTDSKKEGKPVGSVERVS